jgi:hypothetical protein
MKDKELQVKAFTKYELLQSLIKQQSKLFLIMGLTLKEIRDQKLYLHLGDGGFDTFINFLNNPEIGLRQSTAYSYIRIYEYYIERLEMTEEDVLAIPINRLQRLLPALKGKEDGEAKELITNIGMMTNYDYDQEVKEQKLVSDRPLMYCCKECAKYKIEYHEKDICKCDDVFHVTNLTLLEK